MAGRITRIVAFLALLAGRPDSSTPGLIPDAKFFVANSFFADDTGELRDLSDAINRLPSGARHVFVLHGVYGYSHDETGSMLGIATGTSKAQFHRARRLLCQQLDDHGYEP